MTGGDAAIVRIFVVCLFFLDFAFLFGWERSEG
jgi:hypothetical protein